MNLVEIRCRVRGCGALLHAITAPLPPEVVAVRPRACPRHGGVEQLLRQARQGRDTELTVVRVPAETLAPLIERALRRAMTEEIRV